MGRSSVIDDKKIHLMKYWKLYTKLRICESKKVKTVLELYDMEIYQKTSVPHNQMLKTMVKRCVNQKFGLQYFDAGMGEFKQEQWSSQGSKGNHWR